MNIGRNGGATKLFIIGGTGSIGRSLLRELAPDAAAGHFILQCAARSDGSATKIREAGGQPVPFDLDDRLTHPERHVAALDGVDTIFLLTGYTVDMLAQCKAVIDAAAQIKAKHIVHLGLMARPDTRGIHQGWHQLIEAYIERSGLGWTHLHPNLFMDAFPMLQMQNGVYPIAETGPIAFKGYFLPDLSVSWIDTSDIARAAAAILRAPAKHHGQTYTLAVEQRCFASLARMAEERFGRTCRYEMVPVEHARTALASSGMDSKYAESAVNTLIMANDGLLPDFGDVHDDFERLTGCDPVRWPAMLEMHPEWFGGTGRSA